METKSLFYLGLSRYITYAVVFIMSFGVLRGTTSSLVVFSILFVALLGNSSFRLAKLKERHKLFILSILFEACIILVMDLNFTDLTAIYLCILVVDLFLFLKIKNSIQIFVMLCLVFLAIILWRYNQEGLLNSLIDYSINVLGMIFFATAAYLVRKALNMKAEIQSLYDELKESKEQLEDANEKLAEYASHVEEIAVLNERNRLAGEIHDTLGHNLTGLIMEIDICKKLINKDIDRTKTELQKASELARYALSEVRRSVRAIKPEDCQGQVGINALRELIKSFEINSGIAADFNVSKQQYSLSPTIEVAIYRAIQEGLTNCAKYGKASFIKVELDFMQSGVKFKVQDNGGGCSEIEKGVGLKTMEERIKALGGKISFSGMNGFSIEGIIPVEEVR